MKTPFASEDHFLAAIDARFPNTHGHMLLGRGDDCAVLHCPDPAIATTDLFIENVHFRSSYFSPQDIGYKALAVNLSDIAAMGCEPVGFSLALAGPPDTPASYWEGVLDGMSGLAASFDLALTGGDLSACPTMVISITLWGRPGPSGTWMERRRCMPGDVLFAAGDLGLARAGFEALELLGPDAAKDWPDAVAAHLRPKPLVAEGLILSGRRVRGLMDVSDGLARDLPRLLQPGLTAKLDMDPALMHPETVRWAQSRGQDPAVFAVLGGEDYALAGACHRSSFLDVFGHVPGTWAFGEVTPGQEITVNGQPLAARGFDHFA